MAIYLVTGASSGIGENIAKILVRRGDTVYGIARRVELLDELAAELGERFVPYVCDVSDLEQVRNTCDSFQEVPDTAILNAGLGIRKVYKQPDIEHHRAMIEINYFGVMNFVTTLYPKFAERGKGTFAAVSSLAAYRGLPMGDGYCASKAAVTAAMEAMMVTFKNDGIDFISVHPGFVDTPMTEGQKFKMVMVWSAQKAAKYIVDKIDRKVLHIAFPWPLRMMSSFSRFMPSRLYNKVVGNF